MFFCFFFQIVFKYENGLDNQNIFYVPLCQYYAVFSWLNDGPPDCTVMCFIWMGWCHFSSLFISLPNKKKMLP